MLFFMLLFWISLLLLCWTFVGYPLVTVLWVKISPRPWRKKVFSGRVSMIVAAHNEEEVIRDKVDNCLALDFGPAASEIFIVSDGSLDKTNTILESVAGQSDRLRVITYHPRVGKANALNVAAAQAQGEVLVFSDANVMIGTNSSRHLLSPFADPEVGVVCGRVLVKARGDKEVAGESLYMQYEAMVQHAEALLYSMVGVDGAYFAMRSHLFTPLSAGTILDDFVLSMQAPANGLRIVYEPEAEAMEEVVPSAENEFKRKARIVAGAYQFLANFLRGSQSFPFKLWFAFVSHKILRWLAPFLLLALFVANVSLIRNSGYGMLFVGQGVFYLLAVLGFLVKSWRTKYIVYVPYYFCIVNIAALCGFIRFFCLKQGPLWEKVGRQ